MSGMSRRALLLGLATLLLVTPAPLRAWRLDNATLQRVPFPFTLRLAAESGPTDLDGDGLPEQLVLTKGSAAIRTGDRLRWQSPRAWRVEQVRVTDLDRDGVPEITLLVWRPFRPWPVDAWLPQGGRIEDFHDADGLSCHIILVGWKQGTYRELWAGSAMAEPVKSFAAADLLGDGSQYLVALEGKYEDPRSAPARRLKVWEWNGFGFTIVHELEGSFPWISLAQTGTGQELILAP